MFTNVRKGMFTNCKKVSPQTVRKCIFSFDRVVSPVSDIALCRYHICVPEKPVIYECTFFRLEDDRITHCFYFVFKEVSA
jgi:hypothetical protein